MSDEPVATDGLRRPLTFAAMAIALAVLAFWFMVRTRTGQLFGDESILGRIGAAPSLRDGAADVLDTLNRSTAVLIGGAVIGTALVRRRPRLALVTGAWMALAVVGTEVLKRVLVRPDLGVDPPGLTQNMAPSGHTTVAMSLVFGAILVTPRRHRLAIAIIGGVYATTVASGVLAVGWHRPVDPVIASLWVFAVAVLATTALVRWRGDGIDAPDLAAGVDRRLRIAAVVAAALVPFVLIAASFALSDGRVVWTGLTLRFVISAVVIDVIGLVVLAVFFGLVRDLELDAPRPARPSARADEVST